jgi:hypothetical protein
MAKKKAKSKKKAKAAHARQGLIKAIAEEVETEQNSLNKQLTEEEYEQLNNSLSDFDESFLSFLAGTSQYEIIPTTDEFVPQQNLDLIRREAKRLGFKVLYSMDLGKQVLIMNPDTMKIGIFTHITETH